MKQIIRRVLSIALGNKFNTLVIYMGKDLKRIYIIYILVYLCVYILDIYTHITESLSATHETNTIL